MTPNSDVSAVKYDSGKLKWSLLPLKAIAQVVSVLNMGAAKYGANNWKKGLDDFDNRYFDAAVRHIMAWKSGEEKDPESGLHHLAHAVCCLLFLIWRNDPD